MAIKSQNSALYFMGAAGIPGITDGALYRIRGFKNFDFQRGARGQSDTSTLDDDVGTFLAGTVQPGSFSFNIDPDFLVTGHREVSILFDAGVIVRWAFGRADGTDAPTTVRGVGELKVTAGGTTYATAPVVVFTGGAGTGAAATAVLENGVVTSVNVTTPGTGYTSAPAITFTGGGGTGAAATAVLAWRIVPPTTRTYDLWEGYISDAPLSAAINQALASAVTGQISGRTIQSIKV